MDEMELGEKLKEVQLELALELDRICRKHNLRYYLAYGTLIGAIRHEGFIPWDDDIDIMMPYEDLLKFEEVCKTELGTEYFYQSPETDPEYKVTINRIRKNNTLLVEPLFADKNVHKGIFLDIYPLYGAAEGKIKRKIQIVRAMLRALYLLGEPVQNSGFIMRLGSSILLKLKSKKGSRRTADKLFKKIALPFDNGEFVTCLDSGIKEMSTNHNTDCFGNGIYMKFENVELNCPINADKVLTKCYGDYMQLPPAEERCYHHEYLEVSFDTDVIGDEK